MPNEQLFNFYKAKLSYIFKGLKSACSGLRWDSLNWANIEQVAGAVVAVNALVAVSMWG
jgi:hypothetical protein